MAYGDVHYTSLNNARTLLMITAVMMSIEVTLRTFVVKAFRRTGVEMRARRRAVSRCWSRGYIPAITVVLAVMLDGIGRYPTHSQPHKHSGFIVIQSIGLVHIG